VIWSAGHEHCEELGCDVVGRWLSELNCPFAVDDQIIIEFTLPEDASPTALEIGDFSFIITQVNEAGLFGFNWTRMNPKNVLEHGNEYLLTQLKSGRNGLATIYNDALLGGDETGEPMATHYGRFTTDIIPPAEEHKWAIGDAAQLDHDELDEGGLLVMPVVAVTHQDPGRMLAGPGKYFGFNWFQCVRLQPADIEVDWEDAISYEAPEAGLYNITTHHGKILYMNGDNGDKLMADGDPLPWAKAADSECCNIEIVVNPNGSVSFKKYERMAYASSSDAGTAVMGDGALENQDYTEFKAVKVEDDCYSFISAHGVVLYVESGEDGSALMADGEPLDWEDSPDVCHFKLKKVE